VTERVLSETPGSKVTERIVRKFDQTGALVSTERVLIEQQKHGSGETVRETTFRSDLNGGMQESERKNIETTVHGARTDTQTTVDRVTANGFETVEKRSAVSEKTGDAAHSDEMVYRRGDGGSFTPAFRTVTDTTQLNGKTVEKTAQYEPIADVTRMELIKQIVNTTTTRADGSSVSELDYYGPSVPGNVRDPNAKQQLYEQDTIERAPGPGGSVTETLSARRALMSNTSQLGPPIPVSQTVCTGKCSGH